MTMIQLSLFNFVVTRHCPRCEKDLPVTLEFFGSNKARTDGFAIYCRTCNTAYNKEYRAANSEKLKAQKKEWYEGLKDDPETWEQHLKRSREWKQGNPDKVLEYNRGYRMSNRDRRNAYNRAWYDQNPDMRKVHRDTYHGRLQELPIAFTDEQWLTTLDYWQHNCAYCGELATERDHFIPVSAPDDKNPGTVMGNIVPACRTCNAMKHNKMPYTFLRTVYSEKVALEKLIELYQFHRMFIHIERKAA